MGVQVAQHHDAEQEQQPVAQTLVVQASLQNRKRDRVNQAGTSVAP